MKQKFKGTFDSEPSGADHFRGDEGGHSTITRGQRKTAGVRGGRGLRRGVEPYELSPELNKELCERQGSAAVQSRND